MALDRGHGSFGTDTHITESCCVTTANLIKCHFKWTLANFTFCIPEIGNVLYSSHFSADDDANECKWRLGLKMCEEDDRYFSLLIELVSCNNIKNGVRANYRCSIVNGTGKEENINGPNLPEIFKEGTNKGYVKFVTKYSLFTSQYQLLPNNTLTILCQVSMLTDLINTSSQNNDKFKIPACRLSEDFGDLFDSEKFSDITLAVGDKKYKAHKAILAARSPVFAAMFEHDMEEKKNNRVNITDLDHETLRELLYFIYTGRAANVDKMANRLLSASNKYALERLQVMCEEALYQGISVQNAENMFVLADLHSADQLKAAITNFIKKNHKEQ